MLTSVKASAKGSPWPRAKRARTSSRVVMGALVCQGMLCNEGSARSEAPARRQAGRGNARVESQARCKARPGQTRHEQDCLATGLYTDGQRSLSATSPG